MISTNLGMDLREKLTMSTVVSAFWTFDQTTADSYGVYNGAMVNLAAYSTASSSQPYLAYGRALSLTGTSNQSFLVSSPFFNLTDTSFTVEAWIYPTSFTADLGIFSQCQCSTCSQECFYILIRSNVLYAGFTYNYLFGSTTLSTSTWYHIAYVYNYATQQQILYLNGVQDGIVSNVSPYQGTNGSIQIGAAQLFLSTYYFTGMIDNVKLTTRAKSSTELLYTASLTAYYSFDLPSSIYDNGPNGLNGSATSTPLVTGRVNQAMRFSGSLSYFQAYGFYQVGYSMTNRPFSISMWISPTSFTSCVIVQLSQLQTSSTCHNLIGITQNIAVTSGQITVQGRAYPTISGP
ncbi:unnamed protein product, partial [Rotaria sp. Silwood2]